MPVLRVLRSALTGLLDESVTFLAGNLAWLALGFPLYLVLLVPLILLANPGSLWPYAAAAGLLLLLPTPGGLALAAQAHTATCHEAPSFAQFRTTLSHRWRLGVMLYLASAAGLALLGANVWFYAAVAAGWLRLISIPWLYALLLWLALQAYVEPLALHLPAPRVLDLYRRAALLTLAHPAYTGALALLLATAAAVSVTLTPVLLLGAAYVSLVRAFAFRDVRRWHGDLPHEEAAELDA